MKFSIFFSFFIFSVAGDTTILNSTITCILLEFFTFIRCQKVKMYASRIFENYSVKCISLKIIDLFLIIYNLLLLEASEDGYMRIKYSQS